MIPQLLYVAVAGGERSGVHTLEFRPKTAEIREVAFQSLSGAGYLVFSQDGTRLYATGNGAGKYTDGGDVAAFAVAPDGGLTYLNSQPSGGASCCHVTVGGGFVYCANYSGGSFAEFKLAPDGSLERRSQLLPHSGHSAHPTRQASAHPHFVSVTPEGRFLAVVDLGCDGVFFYPFDPVAGIVGKPAGFGAATPGDGPRHLVFNAAGDLAYVANELGNSVSVFDYRDGTMRLRQTASSVPAGFEGESTVAAIRWSDGGRRLWVSNRGHDSLAAYEVKADGSIAPAGHVPSQGNGPRDFVPFGEGRWMAVANEKSDNLAILERPAEAGGTWREVVSMPLASRPIGVLPFPVRRSP